MSIKTFTACKMKGEMQGKLYQACEPRENEGENWLLA